MPTAPAEPIAIVGIGCRFPGASGPIAFWELLREGRDSIGPFPEHRWSGEVDPKLVAAAREACPCGGFLDAIDRFDWRAFRIGPREARAMDPQQRLVLELGWEALEDAGIRFEDVCGSDTGVFIGTSRNDYGTMLARDWQASEGYELTGNSLSFISNRISYFLDLRGPSITINQDCTASAAAIHAACQSLRAGESQLALAGGVFLLSSPHTPLLLSRSGLISPTGRCRTWDAEADGLVAGEGAGLLVLKPAGQVGPSDHVYAWIRGSSLNHNGRNQWIMAASAEAQESAIRRAHERAGTSPAQLEYVELHGSGMLKGDAIEAACLAAAREGADSVCRVGSVKTNIGYLAAASAIAGTIKVALSLYHRQVPPTLHFSAPNPGIDMERSLLRPQTSCGAWDTTLPLAGVNATSLSGTNAHLVMSAAAEARAALANSTGEGLPELVLPLSARDPATLAAMREAWADFLQSSDTPLEDIIYTAAVRRSHHAIRMVATGRNREELCDCLRHAAAHAGDVLPQAVRDYLAGNDIDWTTLSPIGCCTSLPVYPWQGERLWMAAPHAQAEVPAVARPSVAALVFDRTVLHELPAEERLAALECYLREEIACAMGVQADEIAWRLPLNRVGLDSLSSLKAQLAIQKNLAVTMPIGSLLDEISIAELAERLLKLAGEECESWMEFEV